MLNFILNLALCISIFATQTAMAITTTQLNILTLDWQNLQQASLTNAAFVKLGQGFDYYRANAKSQCLDATVGISYQGSSEASVKVFTDYSYTQILNELGVETKVSSMYLGLGGSADIKFAKNSLATNNSISVSYIYDAASYPIQLKALKTHTNLKPYIYKENNFYKAHDEIFDICGDKFVSQLNLGASLRFNMRISFNSDIAKQEIKGALQGKFLNLTRLKAELDNLSSTTKQNSNISIFAQQIGGDVAELTSWLGSEYAKCSLLDINNCIQVLESFFTYQQSVFPKQLAKDTEGYPKGSNWAITKSELTRFSDTLVTFNSADNPEGHGVLLVSSKENNIDTGVIKYRKKLESKYLEQLADERAIANAKNLFANSEDKLLRIANSANILGKNIDFISDAGYICLKSVDECLSSGKEAFMKLEKYDIELLNLAPTVRDGNITASYPNKSWQLQNAHQNYPSQANIAYMYLPDFGASGNMQQTLILKPNTEYEFRADISNKIFDDVPSQVSFDLIDPFTDKVITSIAKDYHDEDPHTLKITYNNAQKLTKQVILKLVATNGLLKVYNVENMAYVK